MVLPYNGVSYSYEMTKGDLNVSIWNNLSDKVTEKIYNVFPLMQKQKLHRDLSFYKQTASISKRTRKKCVWLPLERKMGLKREKTTSCHWISSEVFNYFLDCA